MSRPRRIAAYPGWMVALLSDFEAAPRERVLTFATMAEARAFQLELSGFRGAVRAEATEAMWPNVMAARTRATLTADAVVLRLYHADDMPSPTITS